MILAEFNILIYNRTYDEKSATKVTSEHRGSGAIVERDPYPRTRGPDDPEWLVHPRLRLTIGVGVNIIIIIIIKNSKNKFFSIHFDDFMSLL